MLRGETLVSRTSSNGGEDTPRGSEQEPQPAGVLHPSASKRRRRSASNLLFDPKREIGRNNICENLSPTKFSWQTPWQNMQMQHTHIKKNLLYLQVFSLISILVPTTARMSMTVMHTHDTICADTQHISVGGTANLSGGRSKFLPWEAAEAWCGSGRGG